MYQRQEIQPIFMKDYKVSLFNINQINLDFDIKDEITVVTSILSFEINSNSENDKKDSTSNTLVLNGRKLTLKHIYLNEIELKNTQYEVTDEELIINSVPAKFELKIITALKPEENTSLSGLYKSNDMYCTQCESQGFRNITYYLDRPDVMSKFTTTIRADKAKYPVLLSNGNLIKQGKIDQNRHFAIWEDPFKKPSYLFALVAGKLISVVDHYLTKSGKLVSLKIYVEHQNLDKTAHAMEALKKSLLWDEKNYDLEYDLDIYMIVAVNDFNMGAMENKGLNIFNSKYVLARPETATDFDFAGIDKVIAHEYLHNWSGNRVTLRDWFQLSLKEGFTVFREQQFTDDITKSPISRIEHVKLLRERQFIEDSGPMAHAVRPNSYIEINNFYTLTVYEKGAEVIRMLYVLLGADNFRKACVSYFKNNDGCACTIEDFLKPMSDVSGIDLTQFKLWYSQAGTPEITVEEKYDEEKNIYYLTLTQHCPKTPDQKTDKLPMHIPIALGLLDSNGNDMPIYLHADELLEQNEKNKELNNLMHDNKANDVANKMNKSIHKDKSTSKNITKVISLKEKHQTFTFANVPEKPVLSILRNFSAPVKLKRDIENIHLAFLVLNDNDEFNRWDASQQLMQDFLLKSINTYLSNEQIIMDTLLASTFTKILNDKKMNPSLKSVIIQLPSTNELISNMHEADPLIIHAVKKSILYELIKENKKNLYTLYYENKIKGIYKYEPQYVSKRELKNVVLDYLVRLKEQDIIELCLKQYKKANNMTDQIAAFRALSNYHGIEREYVIADFFNRWGHEPLVINKWLAIQACSELTSTLSTVKKLMRHKSFDIKNPNNVYSLIGAFAMNNPLRFHDVEGKGYSFLSDVIIELNALNPQVAARIIQPLTQWSKFDKNRQEKMKKHLEAIYNTPNLAKDLNEIITKSLTYNL